MNNFDKEFLTDKVKLIAGADEVGRGPLAGPVVAAAVVFDPSSTRIYGIKDSKLLTEAKREKLVDRIIDRCIDCKVSVISHSMIDKINILQASLLAMSNAVDKLKVKPDLVLVDGNKPILNSVPSLPVVDGDDKSYSIAAASIIAKVARDRIMKRLCPKFPQYKWSFNKGYATREHIEAINIYGTTILHRKTFVRKILERNNNYEIEFETELPEE